MEKGLIINKVSLDKIFDQGKVWEMRSTRTNVRGNIKLIESGIKMIVGEADLVGCHEIPTAKNRQRQLFFFHKVDQYEFMEKRKWAWVLNNVKRYDKPIPYKQQ